MSLWRFLFPKKSDLAKAQGLRSELATAVSRHAIATQNSATATEEFRRRMSDVLEGIGHAPEAARANRPINRQ